MSTAPKAVQKEETPMTDTSRKTIPSIDNPHPFTDNDKLMMELVDVVDRTTFQLDRTLSHAKDTIERAQHDLANDMTLNSCGILQSTGIEIDKLVAQRHQAINALITAAFHLGYEEPTSALVRLSSLRK
jgi:hypothetical protein